MHIQHKKAKERDMMRIGMIGLGLMGQIHLKNYLAHPEAEIVALADADPDRRVGRFAAVAGNLDVSLEGLKVDPARSFEDYRDLCAADGIDAVAVSLPSDLHEDAVVRALEAGKHVFCEKPMALRPEQGQRMVAATAASGKTLMIGHCLRFWPEYVAVAKLLKAGKHGRALGASFARCGAAPKWGHQQWFASAARSGGAVVDLHIHDADLAVWWWGRPAEISAGGGWINGSPNLLHSRWSYESGLSAQFEAVWEPSSTAPFYYGFKITLERATVMFDSRNKLGLRLAAGGEVKRMRVRKDSAYAVQDKYFVDCLIAGKRPDRCPPEQSLLTLECVCEEARQLDARAGR